MLVLSRKTSERVCIGEDITVTVLKIRGNTIQLGISAPREVSILRAELELKAQAPTFEEVEEAAAELAVA